MCKISCGICASICLDVGAEDDLCVTHACVVIAGVVFACSAKFLVLDVTVQRETMYDSRCLIGQLLYTHFL